MSNQIFVAFCVGALVGIVIGIFITAVYIALMNRIEGDSEK